MDEANLALQVILPTWRWLNASLFHILEENQVFILSYLNVFAYNCVLQGEKKSLAKHLSCLAAAIIEPLHFCWHIVSQTSWQMKTSIDDSLITKITMVKGLCGKKQ